MGMLLHKRLLVKLSGEALIGNLEFGIDPAMLDKMAVEVAGLHENDVELGLVVGGGNLFRGAGLAKSGLDRVAGDQMGMLATVMNAIALNDALLRHGLPSVVMSGIEMPRICETYTQREARKRIGAGEIIIFAAGTGNPYFTTDTGASLRAIEIQADLMIKATKVDGIYDKDPHKYNDAVKFEKLDYNYAIDQRLAVMDVAAMILCNDNALDMVVCDINQPNALIDLAMGKSIGSRVTVKEV
ncbi:MAG: uridylate kinase [Gammaproteobacteria bacterium]|jgi:uridylate kinase